MQPILRGVFNHDGVWEGVWCMQERDLTKKEACAAFRYENVSRGKLDPMGDEVQFEGYFEVLGANGHKSKYSEKNLRMQFSKKENGGSVLHVKGLGTNKIGKFTLSGTFDENTREMTIKREYCLKKSDKAQQKVAKELGIVATPCKEADVSHTPLDRKSRAVLERLNRILDQVMAADAGKWFCVPVNAKALGLLDYHTIIEKPMDLGTVKSRFASGYYTSPQSMSEDIFLTFSNAMHYNPRGTEVYRRAVSLQDMFRDKYDELLKDPIACAISTPAPPLSVLGKRHSIPKIAYDAELETDEYVPSTTQKKKKPRSEHSQSEFRRLQEQVRKMSENLAMMGSHIDLMNIPPPTAPITENPGRMATAEEKRRLADDIQALPEEKISKIIEIVQNSGIALPSNEIGEVELDMDVLNYGTIQKLRKYIARQNTRY